jgi:hypothetical protein
MSISIKQFTQKLTLSWTIADALATGNAANLSSTKSKFSTAFTFGVGDGQVDTLHEQVITLAPSANTTIDLTTLADMITGDAFAFDVVKMIIVTIDTVAGVTASKIVMEPGASNGWKGFWETTSWKQSVWANGGYIAVSPLAGVDVSSTEKTLKFTNADSTNAAKIRLFLAGIAV